MKQLLTPKLDLVFKLLFTQDTSMLLDLINTILASPEHLRLRSLEVKNPTMLPEEDLTKKFIVLDIRAVDDRNRQYDIEMQVRKYSAYPERAWYYLSKMYAGQLDAGEQYQTLRPVIGIHFLDYEQFSGYDEWQWAFEFRDAHHPEVRLTDHVRLHLLELPKFERLSQGQEWGKSLFEWLHFLNHAHEEGEDEMQTHYQNPAIKKAFQELQKLSADEETRWRAEVRERALKDEISLLADAREEGREEGLFEGLLSGIATVLELKFGEAAAQDMQEIAQLHDVTALRELMDVSKRAATREDVLELVKSKQKTLHN